MPVPEQRAAPFQTTGRRRGFGPDRLLIGDLDDDGCADLDYVGSGHTTCGSSSPGTSGATE